MAGAVVVAMAMATTARGELLMWSAGIGSTVTSPPRPPAAGLWFPVDLDFGGAQIVALARVWQSGGGPPRYPAVNYALAPEPGTFATAHWLQGDRLFCSTSVDVAWFLLRDYVAGSSYVSVLVDVSGRAAGSPLAVEFGEFTPTAGRRGVLSVVVDGAASAVPAWLVAEPAGASAAAVGAMALQLFRRRQLG